MPTLMVVVMKYPWIYLLFMDAVRVSEYTVSTNDELEMIWKWTWPIPDTLSQTAWSGRRKKKSCKSADLLAEI